MKRYLTASERNSLQRSTARNDYSEMYFLTKNCHEESEEIPKCDSMTKFSPTSERHGLPEQSTRNYDINRRYSCMRNFNVESFLTSDDDYPEYLPKGNAKIQFSSTSDKTDFEKSNEMGSCSEKHSFKTSFHDDTSSASDEDIPEDLPHCGYSTESSFESPHKGENKESIYQSQSCICNDEETDLTAGLKVEKKPFKQEQDANNPPASYQKIKTEFPNSTEHRILQQEKTFEEKHDVKLENLKISKSLCTEITMPVRQRHTLSVLTIVNHDPRTSPDPKNISPTSYITEPRVYLKKLKEQLNMNEENEEVENFRQYNENVEDENDEIMIIKDLKLEKGIQPYTVPKVIDLTNEENVTKETEVEVMQNLNVNDEKKEEVKKFAIKQEQAEKKSIKLEKQEEILEIPPDKCSKKKRRRCFHFQKKDSQNCKRTRCQIM